MTSVRRSLAITFLDKYATLAISVVSTMILARLLTPEEIGVFSIASIFVLLASILRDFGVADYLIQVDRVTPESLGAAFALMLSVSWGLAGLIWLGAPLAAQFYNEPGVAAVLHVLAINFLLIPFGAVFMTLLKRAMRFEISLRIHLAQSLTHAGVAIGLAWWGLGYMSLAWASLAGVVATVAVSLWYRPRDIPLRPRLKGIRAVARFGGWASLGTIAGQGADSLPELAIGRSFGMAEVGYFSRANGLIQLFDHSVMHGAAPVVMPHFARLRRRQGDLAAHLLYMTRLVTALAWPFYALLALLAAPVIALLYGHQWDAAVPLAQVLCLYGALKAATPYASMVLKAVNRPEDDGWINLAHLLVLITLLWFTLPLGVEAVAWGVSAAMGVRGGLYLLRLAKAVGFAWGQYFRAVLPSLGLTLLAVLPAWGVVWGWPMEEDLMQWLIMALAGLLGTGMWLLGLWRLEHPLYQELSRAWSRLPLVARHRGG